MPSPGIAALLGATAGAGGGFDPTSISGCVLWLDASDASSITESSGAVSQWSDKSGVGNHATQTSAGAKPTTGTRTINSLNVLDFDGSSDYMDLPNLMSGKSAGTAFVVMQLDADPPGGSSDDGAPLGNFGTHFAANHFPYVDSTIYEDFGSTTRQTAGNPATSMATYPVLVGLISAASDWRCYINGSLLYSTGTNTVGWNSTPLIGKSSSTFDHFIDGRLAEIIIYDSALGTTDRQAVETYLHDKWGTP